MLLAFKQDIRKLHKQKLTPMRSDVSTALEVHIGAFCVKTPPSLVDRTDVSWGHAASNVCLSRLHALPSILWRTRVLKPAFSYHMHPV